MKTIKGLMVAATALLLATVGLSGCASEYKESGTDVEVQTTQDRDLHADTLDAISLMRAKDPSLDHFLNNSWGYAVFPDIAKGGLVLGGASGEGEVYERGRLIGHATLSQATIGAQIGGQKYAEIIFFQNEAALSDFKAGHMELAAQTSAVALESGKAKNADYDRGVAVFTLPRKGLMGEASVGGQKISFRPLSSNETWR